jgi:hypothetical protein
VLRGFVASPTGFPVELSGLKQCSKDTRWCAFLLATHVRCGEAVGSKRASDRFDNLLRCCGPQRAAGISFLARVDVSSATNASTRTHSGGADRRALRILTRPLRAM